MERDESPPSRGGPAGSAGSAGPGSRSPVNEPTAGRTAVYVFFAENCQRFAKLRQIFYARPVTAAAALVEAVGLTKRYPPRDRGGTGFTAVDGIDFALHRGEAFGILGPNGAGKSSTMRMIACVSPISGGTLTRARARPGPRRPAHPRPARRRAAGRRARHASSRVRENLLIYGRYFGLPSR